jgi:carboxypeptidase Taq
MSFAEIERLCRSLEYLEHAREILGADEATHMAVGGGEKRAETLAYLAGLYHRKATAPEIADWIDKAKDEQLGAEQAVALAEFERQYVNQTCLPTEFVQRLAKARIRAEQIWRDLRAKNDWATFLPILADLILLCRDEAAMRSEALCLSLYDAMVEQYDPGMRIAAIEPVFERLKKFLTDFIPRAMEAQAQRSANTGGRPLAGIYPVEKQRELGLALMAGIGFDFTRGSLSVSHHPFCGGVPSDVRLTTRYRTGEFLSSLMGTLHETGHALYEQNLPETWHHFPAGRARGMAMHESQSLFQERQIARGAAFWRFALPYVETHLGERWRIGEILPHVLRVSTGLIRVDADEVTYPMHIVMRFELERELLSGQLTVADINEAWDEKMRTYLGIATIDDPANGPMQDVHWPSGTFGYFPSYTIGAVMAAQQWAALEKEIPEAQTQIANGDFSAINDWRRRNVWSQASFSSTAEIMERATGETLNATYFIRHLEERYGA